MRSQNVAKRLAAAIALEEIVDEGPATRRMSPEGSRSIVALSGQDTERVERLAAGHRVRGGNAYAWALR